MILTKELLRMDDFPLSLHEMYIFDMEAEAVTIAHLQGFYYRAKQRTTHDTAKHFAELIAREITRTHEIGGLNNNRLARFTIPNPPMLSGELRLALSQMALSERRCVYFALLMNIDLALAVQLRWDEVMRLHKMEAINDAATDVLDSLPRHFRSPYVFWKDEPPVPLNDLERTVELVFGFSYDQLRQKFLTMVLVDSPLQAEAFRQQWKGEL